jgi:hypothetical protein
MAVGDFGELTNDDAEIEKVVKFCASNFPNLVREARKPPCTLLHGDARLSNYFFEGAKDVVAVDWQRFNVGSGPGTLPLLSTSFSYVALQGNWRIFCR